MKILAHAPFIGTSGFANHARSFFTALNKIHTVKVRNFTIGHSWKGMNDTPHDNEPYITDEMKDMLIQQTLFNTDGGRSDYSMYGYKNDYIPDIHIILMETNNYYYYDNYDGYKIAYVVWESARFPEDFFKRLFYFDEVWVPSKWQLDCLVEQGYPSHKITIIPEGVDTNSFVPNKKKSKNKKFSISAPIRNTHASEDIDRVLILEDMLDIVVKKTLLYIDASTSAGMLRYDHNDLRKIDFYNNLIYFG